MSKTNQIILWIIAIIVIAGLIWLGYSEKEVVEEGEVIKIGSMLLLSGDGSSWGQASQRAIDLAIKEINEKGGINGKLVEVIYEDTMGSPANAVSVFNKLVDVDNVDLIIGPNFQIEVSAIAPIANERKIPVITPSYAPIENRPNPRNPLLIWLDPPYEAGKLAEYVYNQGIKTISVLGTQDSWERQVSNSFADKFEELGGNVLSKDLVQIDEMDIKTTISKLIKDNPEAFFVGTYYQFLDTNRVLKELGFEGKIYSIEVDEYLANEGKDFTNDLEFVSLDLYKDEFRKKYEDEYNEKANIPAGQTYDTMKIIFSFLEKSLDRGDILKEMENFSEYGGVSGNITITEDHKTIMPTAIYKLNNGVIEKIQ